MPSLWPWLFGHPNPPYDPALVDLRVYEGELLMSKAHGGTLRPPPTTPGREDRDWTLAESQAMSANREAAMALYAWVEQLRIVDPRAVARRRADKMFGRAAGRVR